MVLDLLQENGTENRCSRYHYLRYRTLNRTVYPFLVPNAAVQFDLLT